MARLKVFRAHLGFFDTVVAAPSKKAALQAWGSRQDLFRDGSATITTDSDAVRAALERPGIVLKRFSGSGDAFVEQPPLPKPPPDNKQGARAAHPKTETKKPDRSKLDAAEHALTDLKQQRENARSEFERRERALRQERQAREQQYEKQEAELERRLAAEMKAYKSALSK